MYKEKNIIQYMESKVKNIINYLSLLTVLAELQ